MLASHSKAMAAIESCRTADLGGHVYHCTKCKEDRFSYHSCKNRYCPQCQNEQAETWLCKQQRLLINAPYFLVTFTLPAELRGLARSRQKTVYRMLMKVSARTLMQVMRNRKWLGGKVGILSVLQTWTRDLRFHPHVHMLVVGGALSEDQQQWLQVKMPYLAPQQVLGKVFAGKFRDALARASLLELIPARVWKQNWVVDVLAVGGGESALKYLAPYIFRIAISNRRILKLENGKVTFVFKDAKKKKEQRAVLEVDHFIHRFLQHVLPHRFIKVRTYGLFSPANRHLLQKAKELIGIPRIKQSERQERVYPPELRCPDCKEPMKYLGELPRKGRSP